MPPLNPQAPQPIASQPSHPDDGRKKRILFVAQVSTTSRSPSRYGESSTGGS